MTGRSTPRKAAPAELTVGGYARLDRERTRRTGVPEIVFAEGKSTEQLVGILRALHRRAEGALVSRPTAAQLRRIRAERATGLPVRELAGGRVLRLLGPLRVRYAPGPIALVTAGTSDVLIAEEARAVLDELGIRTVTAYDVGVAGLHRLLRAVRRLERARPRCYLVFAGREGALATVVAGLVRAPVVGVPVSIGYGRGGSGEGALSSMLQSCAPLAVVNIDAAVPAALFAAHLLARRAPDRIRARRPGALRSRPRS
ncbi:MAG: nickel pincer cofactor biosynthesis protein LarB [Thermoplasmata archaeon]